MDPNLEAPQTHMWGLSLQRELGKEMVLEVNHMGRRGHNLFGGYDVNQVNIFATHPTCPGETFLEAFNTVAGGGDSCLMNALFAPDPARGARTGSEFVRDVWPSTLALGSVANLASSINTRLVGGVRMLELAGFSPYFFIPFPQFSYALNVLDTSDLSTYHRMEIQVSRRFTCGLGFQLSYTWAKSLDTRSFDPAFSRVSRWNYQSASSTPFDIHNRRLNKARSDFDREHALQSFWVWELPFGAGRRWGSGLTGALERLVGGWEISGILRWLSGRPFTIYSGAYAFSNVVQSPADCAACPRTMGAVHADPGNRQVYYLNSDERAKFFTPAPGTVVGTPGATPSSLISSSMLTWVSPNAHVSPRPRAWSSAWRCRT